MNGIWHQFEDKWPEQNSDILILQDIGGRRDLYRDPRWRYRCQKKRDGFLGWAYFEDVTDSIMRSIVYSQTGSAPFDTSIG